MQVSVTAQLFDTASTVVRPRLALGSCPRPKLCVPYPYHLLARHTSLPYPAPYCAPRLTLLPSRTPWLAPMRAERTLTRARTVHLPYLTRSIMRRQARGHGHRHNKGSSYLSFGLHPTSGGSSYKGPLVYTCAPTRTLHGYLPPRRPHPQRTLTPPHYCFHALPFTNAPPGTQALVPSLTRFLSSSFDSASNSAFVFIPLNLPVRHFSSTLPPLGFVPADLVHCVSAIDDALDSQKIFTREILRRFFSPTLPASSGGDSALPSYYAHCRTDIQPVLALKFVFTALQNSCLAEVSRNLPVVNVDPQMCRYALPIPCGVHGRSSRSKGLLSPVLLILRGLHIRSPRLELFSRINSGFDAPTISGDNVQNVAPGRSQTRTLSPRHPHHKRPGQICLRTVLLTPYLTNCTLFSLLLPVTLISSKSIFPSHTPSSFLCSIVVLRSTLCGSSGSPRLRRASPTHCALRSGW
ncbi:hypothetical protein C8F04DRAFT_1263730 [Mycena alexandri]|uniref:Uncharacterized protein n=1 Tax=Mycena alexandri TaxID=1745969 RepID=A0AAD6SP91_9AGAR|nr:hypothetical protein C8F04DRAFT_1263730 [Mycena alexandri]